MSVTAIAHKCTCAVKTPYFVDKETENVYHETCEGFIAHVDDMHQAIEVKNLTPYEELISVEIEGECDHAGAEIEYLEYAKSSWWADAHCYVNDDSETLPTLVCKCGFEEIQEPEEPDYEPDYYED